MESLLPLVLIVTIILLVFRAFSSSEGPDRPVIVIMPPQPEAANPVGCLPIVFLVGLILLLLATNGITLTP